MDPGGPLCRRHRPAAAWGARGHPCSAAAAVWVQHGRQGDARDVRRGERLLLHGRWPLVRRRPRLQARHIGQGRSQVRAGRGRHMMTDVRWGSHPLTPSPRCSPRDLTCTILLYSRTPTFGGFFRWCPPDNSRARRVVERHNPVGSPAGSAPALFFLGLCGSDEGRQAHRASQRCRPGASLARLVRAQLLCPM